MHQHEHPDLPTNPADTPEHGPNAQTTNPTPEPDEILYCHVSQNGFKTPYYQWSLKLAQTERPEECHELTEQMYRELQVEKGQPYRKALLDEEEMGLPLPKTSGPLMLPDSFDPIANPDPDNEPGNEPAPGLPLRTWKPGTPAHEILSGMAQDMIEVGSVMVARMRVALGYESDAKMIRLYKELALSLYKMHHITRASKPKRPRGRPRKNP